MKESRFRFNSCRSTSPWRMARNRSMRCITSGEMSTTSKVLNTQLDSFLCSSGTAGIFINPCGNDGEPANDYKVVWTEDMELNKVLAIAKSLQEVFGVVRGRTGFGYRVKTKDYINSRKKLEPGWAREELKYNIITKVKYLMTPLPLDVDKAMLQKILSQMCWAALPLRQKSQSTWLVGAESFWGKLVLVTEENGKSANKGRDTPILAAPNAIRRALDKQIRHGHPHQPWETRSSASASSTLTHSSLQPAPQMTTKADVEEKMATMHESLKKAIGTLEKRLNRAWQQSHAAQQQVVDQLTVNIRGTNSSVDELETQISNVSQQVCTKTDLTAILAEALAKQNADFQRMMSERHREPSPVHDSNKQAKQT